MKLKFEAENIGSFALEAEGRRNAERKNRWYDKLYDVAAKFGENVAKIACVVAVPTIIALTSGCTCTRIELEGDTHEQDAPTDVSHEDAHEEDTISEDVLPDDVVEEDVPEEELPPVCDNLLERNQINNLIGDYLNRRLDDRVANTPDDTEAAYPLSTSETNENANPFSDGMAGSLGSAETYLYRITGAAFAPLADSTVVDDNAGRSYTESQNIWINGSNYYDDAANEVVGHLRFIAYNAKLKGSSDDFGIPVCTTPVEGNYTYCKSGAPDANLDYATEVHRVRVNLLGGEWLITEMSPPSGVEVTNEIQVLNGGYVKLAKELASGILNVGEALEADGFRFVLDEIETTVDRVFANISVVEIASGDVVKRDRIEAGQTKEFNLDGEIFRLRAWKIAPGYTPGARWADISILSDEIKIEDGMQLDPDTDRFPGWHSVVAWKNRMSWESTDPKPDHLRTVFIYSDDVAEVSSSGEEQLLRGEGITFPTDNFEICYGGLDITDEERGTLTFALERESDYENYIPTLSHGNCVIYAPYVKMTSEIPFAGVSVSGENVDTLYVAMNGGGCRDEDMDWSFHLESGALVAAAPNRYFAALEYGINMLATDLIEDEISVGWSRWGDDGVGYVDLTREVDNQPTFVFRIKEIAGGDVSLSDAAMYFATDGNSFNLDVNHLDTSERVFGSDHLVYQAAGPVWTRGEYGFIGQGIITERGSVFRTIDDTQVVFDIANRVAYSVFYIGKKE